MDTPPSPQDPETALQPGALLGLEGAFNARDAGGWPCAGGMVATRRLLRSDNLHGLTDGDVAILAALGLRTVVDLRAVADTELYTDRLPDGVTFRNIPINDNPGALPLGHQLRNGTLREFSVEQMAALYSNVMEHWAGAFGEAVSLIADTDRLPLLVHCTAGKDRTGITCALVLDTLGVSRDIILAEHGRSTGYWGTRQLERLRPILAEHDVDVEKIRPLVESTPEVLDDALRTVEERHGSLEGYLVGPCGCPDDIGDRLRAALVVPAGD